VTDKALGSLFPTWYQTALNPPSVIEFVIINWLAMEVPAPRDIAAILLTIRGWTHREVYDFMRAWDWTASMYEHEPIAHCEHEMGFPARFS